MNPQDQNQPQPQQPALSDAQVEDKFIKENAQALLDGEAANPGSQDPAALEWARGIVGHPLASSGDVPQPPAIPISGQQPGQMIQPSPSEQAASPDGHVLYIDRSEPPIPPQDNAMNGDNNGNSN